MKEPSTTSTTASNTFNSTYKFTSPGDDVMSRDVAGVGRSGGMKEHTSCATRMTSVEDVGCKMTSRDYRAKSVYLYFSSLFPLLYSRLFIEADSLTRFDFTRSAVRHSPFYVINLAAREIFFTVHFNKLARIAGLLFNSDILSIAWSVGVQVTSHRRA